MSLYALPTIAEQVFKEYITEGHTGNYLIQKAFTADEYTLPMILVKVGQLKEIEPGTDVYEGKLIVSIISQIDDVEDVVATHDATVAEVYDILANQGDLFTVANSAEHFHLWGMYSTGYDQERADRQLISMLEYTISIQILATV